MARENSNRKNGEETRSPFVLPILRELHTYKATTFRSDVMAGTTVALVSIPQTMGFALIIGIPPQMVLYAAIVGVLFTALFGSSRHLIAGPTTSISIIIASTIHTLDSSYGAIQIVVTLAFLIGLIQILAGLVKLGTLNRFISRSVITGYLTGVAVLIAFAQVNNLIGVGVAQSADVITVLQSLKTNILEVNINMASVFVGTGTILFLVLVQRFRPRWPGGLLVLVLTGFLSWAIGLSDYGVRLISDIGGIVPALPAFGADLLPDEFTALIPLLIGPAIAIAILGMLETVSLGKAVAVSSGQKINANQEIVGLGVGNMMASIFGTMAGSASLVRTATNLQSGAKTQVAAVISSLMVGLIILIFARFANFIPIPALAAMLIFVVVRMINREQILIAVNSTRSDAIVFAATFLSTLFLRLDTAIFVGVAASLVLFLRKAATPHLVEYAFTETGALSQLDSEKGRSNEQISIIHVEGELFFGAAEVFQDQIREIAEDEGIRVFILRLKNARHMDATAIVSLNQLLEFMNRTGRHLLISGVNEEVESVLINSGFMKRIGSDNVFRNEQNPTMSTKRALLRASHILQTSSPEIRLFYNEIGRRKKPDEPRIVETGPPNFQI